MRNFTAENYADYVHMVNRSNDFFRKQSPSAQSLVLDEYRPYLYSFRYSLMFRSEGREAEVNASLFFDRNERQLQMVLDCEDQVCLEVLAKAFSESMMR